MDGRIIRWQRESDRRERECYRWEACPPSTDVGTPTMKSCRDSGVLFPPLSLILAPRLLSRRIQRIASRVPKPRACARVVPAAICLGIEIISLTFRGRYTATTRRRSNETAGPVLLHEPSALSGIIATTFSAAINLIIATVPRRRARVMVSFAALSAGFVPSALGIPTGRRAYRSPSLSLSLSLCPRRRKTSRDSSGVQRSRHLRRSELYKAASRVSRPVITKRPGIFVYTMRNRWQTRCSQAPPLLCVSETYAENCSSNNSRLVAAYRRGMRNEYEYVVRFSSVIATWHEAQSSVIFVAITILRDGQTRPPDLAILTGLRNST